MSIFKSLKVADLPLTFDDENDISGYEINIVKDTKIEYIFNNNFLV